MSEPDEYLATLYVEDHRGDRAWVTERVCQDSHSGTRWIETELNARRQEVTLGTQEDWRYESRVVPKFQVITHVNPPDGETELTARLSWPDEGSARLFATALLRSLHNGNFGQEGYRCWCEVWAPDETGEFVDSAYPGPQTGYVEWDSEIIDAVAPA